MRTARLAATASALLLISPMVKAEAQRKFADIEISIDDPALQKKDTGIRTLYVTLYDAASSMPMPYGALKVDLDKDAKGTFYKGELNSTNVMIMGGGDVPKTLRIKARLDKDGSAGRDEAGDLVGIADQVSLGAKVKVVINRAI
ncbi:MAG: hypothetical protein FJ146_16805 [Deltaproteobacteria bacterium]|nr:hypothetical protein [Deltaproteobacteria bacterium]